MPSGQTLRASCRVLLFSAGAVWCTGAGCVWKATHAELQRSHDALRSDVATLERKSDEQQGQALDLEEAVSERDRRIGALEAEVERLEGEVEALQGRMAALAEVNDSVTSERAKLRASLKELQRELHALSQSKKAAEARAAEHKAVVERFEAIVEALD
jgi:chromosome segregation ATPase